MLPNEDKPKKKSKFAWYFFGLLIVLLIGLAVTLAWGVFHRPAWWRFAPAEQITQPPLIYRDLAILVTNHGTVTALDRNSGKIKWEFKKEKEIIIPLVTKNERIYVGYNDGVVISLDVKSGKQVWEYHTPANIATAFYFSETTLYFADFQGWIHAISLRSGKEIWSYESPRPESVDQVFTEYGPNWFGTLFLNRGVVYAARISGAVSALRASDGKLLWEKQVAGVVTSDPVLTRTALIATTDKHSLYSIDTKTGNVVQAQVPAERTSIVFCQASYSPSSSLAELRSKTGEESPFHFLLLEENKSQEIIQVDESGSVYSYNRSTLKNEWSLKLPFSPKTCFFDQQSVFVASRTGQLVKVNLKSHAISWQKDFPSELLLISSIRKAQFIQPDDQPLYYNTDFLFVTDNFGTVYRLNYSTGEIRWQFSVAGRVYVPPVLEGRSVFLVSTNGGVYRVTAQEGKPDQIQLFPESIHWKQNTATVAEGQVYELSVHSKSSRYINPYTEVNLQAAFTDEHNQTITVDGFFYDTDEWRVRFNPLSKGKWNWKLDWIDQYQTRAFHGSFMSLRDHQFLHSAIDQPKWITKDNKTIAPLVGLNDCVIDRNVDRSPLDDFFVEGGSLRIATISGIVSQTLTFNAKIISLEEYLKTYRVGFNAFRQNVDNCSPPLFVPENFMSSKFLAQEGKYHDQVSQELFKQNYSIWFTMFSFSLPFGNGLTYPDEKVAVENYVKYVVARYGAYVDIWEVGNEAVISDEYAQTVADMIGKHDPHHRLISVSWEKPEVKGITLIAPHWYETETDQSSDLAALHRIERYQQYPKPVLFGEHGNQTTNWDPTSAQRMRVRIWTTFFNQSALFFWNESEQKGFYNPIFQNSNIYLGDTERQYAQHFLKLTRDLPVDLKPSNNLSNGEIRSYTLSNNKLLLRYFFHPSLSSTTTTFTNPFPKTVILEWIDPATAEVKKTEKVNVGATSISPTFSVDILVRVSSE